MKALLFLTQTDTTIGFVSQNTAKIDHAKERLDGKFYIKTFSTLSLVKEYSRLPQKHKNTIRRARKTSFILSNHRSFRVIKDTQHNLLLDRISFAFSSSANKSGESFDKEYCQSVADVIVAFPYETQFSTASKILKLTKESVKKIR